MYAHRIFHLHWSQQFDLRHESEESVDGVALVPRQGLSVQTEMQKTERGGLLPTIFLGRGSSAAHASAVNHGQKSLVYNIIQRVVANFVWVLIVFTRGLSQN